MKRATIAIGVIIILGSVYALVRTDAVVLLPAQTSVNKPTLLTMRQQSLLGWTGIVLGVGVLLAGLRMKENR